MTAWWSGELTVFDLETDGVDPTDARIVTGCVAMIRKGQNTEVGTWMAQTERAIPQEASDVHGITTERADAEGKPRRVVIKMIAAWLASGSAGSDGKWGAVPIVGHNIAYDLTVLDREMRRTGIGRLTTEDAELGMGSAVTVWLNKGGRSEPIGAFYCIDTMVMDKALDRYRKGPEGGGRNKLEIASAYYGVPIQGDAHSADADALASGRMAWVFAKRCAMARGIAPGGGYDQGKQAKFLELYRDRWRDGRSDPAWPAKQIAQGMSACATLDLPSLHAWQRRMAREQADSFRQHCIDNPAYAAEKGIDPDQIRGDWPLTPWTAPSTSSATAQTGGLDGAETVSTLLD